MGKQKKEDKKPKTPHVEGSNFQLYAHQQKAMEQLRQRSSGSLTVPANLGKAGFTKS